MRRAQQTAGMHFTTRKAALVLGGLTAGMGLGAAAPSAALSSEPHTAPANYDDEIDRELGEIGNDPSSRPDEASDPAATAAAAAEAQQAAAEEAAAEQAAAAQAAADQAAAAAAEKAAAEAAAAEKAAAEQAAAEQAAAEKAAAEKAAAEQKAAAEAEGASGAATPEITPVAAAKAPTIAPALPETGTMPTGNSFGPGLIALAGSGSSQPATDELKARAAKKAGAKTKPSRPVKAAARTLPAASTAAPAVDVVSAAPIAQRSDSLIAGGHVPDSASFELKARSGETLWSLAADALGKDASLDQIVRLVTYLASLNRHLEGETLAKGEQLRLPVLFEGHDLRIIEFNRLHAG